MFSEFDILEKELENDDYKLHCVIECTEMEIHIISSSEDVVTEAEGSDVSGKIAAIKEKIKKIIDAIKEKLSEAMKKISNFFTTQKIKDEYEALLKKAKAMQSDAGSVLEHNEKWKEYLDKKAIKMYDFAEQTKHIRTLGDAVVAGAKNIAAKIKGGKTVKVSEITEIRSKANDFFSDKEPGDRKIKNLSDIISLLGTAGIVGGVVKALTGDTNAALISGAVIGTCSQIAIGIVDIINGNRSPKYRDAGDTYVAAAATANSANEANASAIASLGEVVANAETMSYRKAIKYLKQNLDTIDSILEYANDCVGVSAANQLNAESKEKRAKRDM